MIERVIADLVSTLRHHPELVRALAPRHVRTDGKERERHPLRRRPRIQPVKRNVVHRGCTLPFRRTEAVDLVVVRDLVEIDADGAELHRREQSVSQRQLARRAIDRPSHAIFTEVLPLHAIDPQAFRPLKRVEYERLVDLGAFEDEKVECSTGRSFREPDRRAPQRRDGEAD